MSFRGRLPIAMAIALIAALFLQRAYADEQAPTTRRADADKYMFIDEVKPGMKGHGLTVFSGTKIEKFDVEIISVLYNIGPRSDLILARIEGGPIERAGVIAGMSGSPIYIDGRIIGALAYSWAFSKEAIAGITPIGEMLSIFDFEESSGEGAVGRADTGPPVSWAGDASLDVALPGMASGSVAMRPIMTPMVFSGFSRDAVEMFRPHLEDWGIVPVIGGSFSERLADVDASLEEGSSIGIMLVSGDMVTAGVGTVTINDNGKILAFGHPFMLSGSVDFPMTTAYVHTVLPSLVASSKVGSPLRPVGTLTQDRSPGISGVVGDPPEMAPFSLNVHGGAAGASRTYSFEIARSRWLFPALAGMTLRSALSQSASSTGDFTAKVHYDIELEGLPTVSNDAFISGLRNFPSLATLGLYRDLNTLLENRFTDVFIKSISIDIDVLEAVESARITSARVRKDTLRPGEDIELKVFMKPYMKESIEKNIVVSLPEHFPEGRAFLQVSAAPQTASFENIRASSRFRPDSIERLVELVDEDYPGNRLDVRLLVSDPGMVVNGLEMSALPSSVFSVIASTIGREPVGITRASVLLEEQFLMDFQIEGAIIIPIRIDRRAP